MNIICKNFRKEQFFFWAQIKNCHTFCVRKAEIVQVKRYFRRGSARLGDWQFLQGDCSAAPVLLEFRTVLVLKDSQVKNVNTKLCLLWTLNYWLHMTMREITGYLSACKLNQSILNVMIVAHNVQGNKVWRGIKGENTWNGVNLPDLMLKPQALSIQNISVVSLNDKLQGIQSPLPHTWK